MSQPEVDLRQRKAHQAATSNVTAQTSEGSGNAKTGDNVVLLKNNSARWKNWTTRFIFTWSMIFGFFFIIYLGPIALTLLIFALQLKCFQEVIQLGYTAWPKELPWFRSLNWFFLLAANYFFYGEHFNVHLTHFFVGNEPATSIIKYHRFISFCLYMMGFCTFVLSLRKGCYTIQFKQFAMTHLSLLLIVATSQLILRSIYEGLLWFLLPSCLVICNDIMAYFFGFFFGRTPMIKLSPKKTWEGFIGAFLSTLCFGVAAAYGLSRFSYFTCPVDSLTDYSIRDDCHMAETYTPQSYKVPALVADLLYMFGLSAGETVQMIPVLIHGFVLAVFASLIAPFGGFFASGLKRAFKIKDFADMIPGHGGITDRFDCQFVMAVFAYVYYHSFVKPFDTEALLTAISLLAPEDQEKILVALASSLQKTIA
eukprot:m.82430 g.82430  ORF g.82430 m.82430 type:complete len:424 (-) comp12690_c0_seq1:1077-2348(-)